MSEELQRVQKSTEDYSESITYLQYLGRGITANTEEYRGLQSVTSSTLSKGIQRKATEHKE
jgi:hypothetical protein